MTAICNIPNCGRRCPDEEPFCSEHRGDQNWQAEADYRRKRADALEAKLKALVEAATSMSEAMCFDNDARVMFKPVYLNAEIAGRWGALEDALRTASDNATGNENNKPL